jgi:hypothetical protein
MLNKKTGLMALLVGFAASEIMAGDFSSLTSYNAGDVLVCFRKGGNDMVVDAGPISTLTNATANQRIPITQYTGTQLADVGTNSVSWSAFTWLTNNSTLFITKARGSASLNSQTAPWPDEGSPAQSATAARMATIPLGAYDEYGLNQIYAESIATAVVEQDNSDGSENGNYPDGNSYYVALAGAYGGDFDGYFEGNPENTTLANFTTSGQVVRSDFYQLTPTTGHASGTYLGYFELSTNGSMTYVAYPTAIPVIKSFNRAGNTTTIIYTTGTYGTYTLCGTNDLTAPVATWPVISTLNTGDTSLHSTTDTTTDNSRFYIITAQ